MAKILVVDDDKSILALIKNILLKEQHEVHLLDNLENMEISIFQGYELIILDIMMPYINGIDLCKKLIGIVKCPIIFLSAKTAEDDKVNGFSVGADDYIEKPFSVQEFSARINAHLRREKRDRNPDTILIDGVLINFKSKEISYKENLIPLTKYEYMICELLIRNKGQIFTVENIYENIYDMDSDTQFRTITEFIYSIRKKFKKLGIDPISTIWGLGYKWKIEKIQ